MNQKQLEEKIKEYETWRERIILRRNDKSQHTYLYWTLNGQSDILDDILKDLRKLLKPKKVQERCACGHAISKHISSYNDSFEDVIYQECKIHDCDCEEFGDE